MGNVLRLSDALKRIRKYFEKSRLTVSRVLLLLELRPGEKYEVADFMQALGGTQPVTERNLRGIIDAGLMGRVKVFQSPAWKYQYFLTEEGVRLIEELDKE